MQLLVTIVVFVLLFAFIVIRCEQNAKLKVKGRTRRERIQQRDDIVADEAFGGAFLSQSLGHMHGAGPLATRSEVARDVGCDTKIDISSERDTRRDPECRVELAVEDDDGDDDD